MTSRECNGTDGCCCLAAAQVPDNYQRKVLPDNSKAMQGVPAMVWQPPRYFMEHKTPTVLGEHNTNRQTVWGLTCQTKTGL